MSDPFKQDVFSRGTFSDPHINRPNVQQSQAAAPSGVQSSGAERSPGAAPATPTPGGPGLSYNRPGSQGAAQEQTVSRSIVNSSAGNNVFSITGGDSNMGYNRAFVANSRQEQEFETSNGGGVGVDVPANTKAIEISDDSTIHGNSHAHDSTVARPVTVNTGHPDGDTYNIMGSPNSTTTINGASRGEGNGVRDTINYHSHISDPSVRNTINLKDFNPSKTDLKIDGKSVFGEDFNTSLNGSIEIGATDGSNSERSFQINLEH